MTVVTWKGQPYTFGQIRKAVVSGLTSLLSVLAVFVLVYNDVLPAWFIAVVAPVVLVLNLTVTFLTRNEVVDVVDRV